MLHSPQVDDLLSPTNHTCIHRFDPVHPATMWYNAIQHTSLPQPATSPHTTAPPPAVPDLIRAADRASAAAVIADADNSEQRQLWAARSGCEDGS